MGWNVDIVLGNSFSILVLGNFPAPWEIHLDPSGYQLSAGREYLGCSHARIMSAFADAGEGIREAGIRASRGKGWHRMVQQDGDRALLLLTCSQCPSSFLFLSSAPKDPLQIFLVTSGIFSILSLDRFFCCCCCWLETYQYNYTSMCFIGCILTLLNINLVFTVSYINC